MDPVSLALTFFLNNPSMAAAAVNKATAPGTVDVSRMQESLVDLSRGVLKCYHPTARFNSVDAVGSPWPRQSQYGAEKSLVIRIRYAGLGAINRYEMVVAMMGKPDKVRAAVISDSAVIPHNKKCALEEWTGAQAR